MSDLSYDQLLEQIHQLPNDEFEKLVNTLSAKRNLAKTMSKENMQQLLLRAPTWSDQQLDEYQQARDFINQSRLG